MMTTTGCSNMKITTGNFWMIYFICFVIGMFAVCKYAFAAPVGTLNISTLPDRSSPQPLSGATVSGDVYISFNARPFYTISLSWNPNADLSDPIKHGYRIFQGPLMTVENGKFGPDVMHDITKFVVITEISDEKRVEYKFKDSILTLDDTLQSCFRLRAFNESGESGFSKAICGIIDRIESVAFYIDDETKSSPPFKIEYNPPYDFAGAASDGSALPFNMNALPAGQHTITAFIKFKNQTLTDSISGSFSIVKKPPNAPTGLTIRKIN